VTPLPARASAFPQLTGFNTDGFGLAQALREEFQLELCGKRIAILGAGGAAQAAAVQCAQDGATEIFILNRTAEKATALARTIRAAFPSVNIRAGFVGAESSGARSPELDLMINATSLGLHPNDPQPIACENISGVPFVYDMIYRPVETKFLRCAREAGAQTANGLSMLLHQGVRALDLWLTAHVPEKNLRAPVEVMRAALLDAMK
jgi:shikimate dehydrogenase